MNRRKGLLAGLGCLAAIRIPLASAQAPARPVGELKSLGQERYLVGRIVVDKRARRFTVPGRVHLFDKPLEYLATSPGGMKAYETLFEVDATGSEFNLACILIGLERDPKVASARPSDQAPLVGPRVAIAIAWSADGKRRQVSAAQALLNPEADIKPESVEWVYVGAPASEGQDRFTADDTGTLIGFKPDDNNVIESATGIGIGAYGSVRGHAMLPPVGTAIELIVEAVNAAK
ncbi:MAG: YdjY domain-containing protein [Rubrivivax sp.]|nr:YdjY domain-containing protein [Rubrivivax sp.]